MNQPIAVHVSNRQYNVMREALQSNGIRLDRMIEISQVTVGGLFRRGFMAFNKKAGEFQLTKLGVEVMKQYSHTDVDRKDHSRPLSKYVPGNEALRKQVA